MIKISLNEKEFLFREIDGETMVLNPTTGDSHLLDDIGTIMLRAICDKKEKEKALEALYEYFDETEKDKISTDFNAFIQDLIDKKVLSYE